MKTPKVIMDAAKGEQCTLNMVGVCIHDPETSVMAHLPDGTGGSNRLTGPLSIAIACYACHGELDSPSNHRQVTELDREFYMRRGLMRTLDRLIDKGLIQVKGL